MNKETKYNNEMEELRVVAEEMLGKKSDRVRDDLKDDFEKVLHELNVYQIELEMQNEEIKRTSVELEASRTKYADLYDFAPIGYFTINEKGIILEANLTGCHMLGVERNFLIKKPFGLFVDKKTRDTYYLHRKYALIPNSKRTCEITLVRMDKEKFEARLDSIAVVDAKGHVTGCRTSVIDITERKKAQRQVYDLAKFPEEDPFPVLRISEDGTIIYSNYPGKVLLADWKSKIGRKVPGEWYDSIQEALKSNRYLVKDFPVLDMVFSITFAPVKDSGYVNIYGQDITQKKLARRSIAESEKKYRRLFNTMSEGFALHEIILDENGNPCDYRFLEINPAFEEITGLKAIDITGKTVKEVIPDFQNFTKSLNKYYEVFAFRPSPMQFAAIFADVTKRVNAEKMLRYQASLLDNISDAVMSIDNDLTILSWNKAAELMYGWSEEEVKGKSLKQFMKVEYLDHTTIEDVLREVFENGKWAGEVIQKRRDGQKFYVSASLTAIKNAEGESIGFIAVDRDITEHKKAEKALRESEVRYRTLGDTVSYGFWHTDAEGKCTYVSDSFLEMTGMTLHEVLEFGWMHLLPEKDIEPTKEQWLHCVKTGEDFQREQCFRSKDGTPRYVLAIGRPVRDEEGKIISWVGINLDITQRKKAEEALYESEQRFRVALRNAPVSIAVQDRNLRYIWVYNQKSLKTEDIINRFDEDIFTPEEAAHFKDIKPRVLIEGSDFSEQMWIRKPNGRMFLHFTWEPMFDKKGNIIGIVSSAVDMTQIKIVEEEMKQKNEELMKFNKYAVGRELRMIELKREINSLCESVGQPDRYKLDFVHENRNDESISEEP